MLRPATTAAAGQMASLAELSPDLVALGALGEPRWIDWAGKSLLERPTAACCSTAALRYSGSSAHHLPVSVPSRRCLGNSEVGQEAGLVRKQR